MNNQNQNQKRKIYSSTNPPPKPTLNFEILDKKTGQLIKEKSKTKQHFKQECDINHIMSRYSKDGVLPAMIKAEPRYGDFADPVTYQEALNLVIFSREQFDALPSKVRERFANDPAKFLEFCSDPSNTKELIDMKLATEITPTPEDPMVKELKEINTNLKASKTKQKLDSTES